MATTYSEAPPEVIDLMNGVIDEFFESIRRCEPAPVISVLMADNEDGAALKKYGAGVVAMIKKSTKEDKAEDGPDLRILIDAERWRESNPRRRRAILCHEIRHVKIQWEPGGKVPQTDDYGRPKIKLLPDDWVLTGFEDVAGWFGDDAVEVRAVKAVHASLCQLGLPFMADQSAAVARVAELDREAVADAVRCFTGDGEIEITMGGVTTTTPIRGDVIEDTFAALITVGHTEQQARHAIDLAIKIRPDAQSVNELIEVIYGDSRNRMPAREEPEAEEDSDEDPAALPRTVNLTRRRAAMSPAG